MSWSPSHLEHPRFCGVADLVARVANEPDWPSVARLDELFRDELATVGIRLVEAAKAKAALTPEGTIDIATLYEVRIVDRGEVPTRPRNAHDFLNAVIWAAFPRSKLALSRALAAVQRERAAGQTRMPSTRSRDHDRLALVDEGAVLHVRDVATGGSTMWIFGHAILEHAYAGRLDVRGAAVDLEVHSTTGSMTGSTKLAAARDVVDHAFAVADLARVVRGGPGVAIVDHALAHVV